MTEFTGPGTEDETVIIDPNGDEPMRFGEQASLVDLLRRDQEEVAGNKEVFIPVQGYERTGLAVKYHLPDNGKEMDNISRKVMREYKDTFSRNLYIGMDSMIYLCSGLYVRPPEAGDEYVEFDPDGQGQPVQFDYRLAEILNMPDNNSARAVVKRIFGGNDMAIINHAEKLSRWMMNTNADLDLEVWQLGEAQT